MKPQREFQQTAKGFNISEIVQGGSLGYGTAVPENHDIDLVLYSRGNSSVIVDSYIGTCALTTTMVYLFQ